MVLPLTFEISEYSHSTLKQIKAFSELVRTKGRGRGRGGKKNKTTTVPAIQMFIQVAGNLHGGFQSARLRAGTLKAIFLSQELQWLWVRKSFVLLRISALANQKLPSGEKKGSSKKETYSSGKLLFDKVNFLNERIYHQKIPTQFQGKKNLSSFFCFSCKLCHYN